MSEVVLVALIGMTATLLAGPITTAFDKHAERKAEQERRRDAWVNSIGEKVQQLLQVRTDLHDVITQPQSDEELRLALGSKPEYGTSKTSSDEEYTQTYFDYRRYTEQIRAWERFKNESAAILLNMAFMIRGENLQSSFNEFRTRWKSTVDGVDEKIHSALEIRQLLTGELQSETDRSIHDFVGDSHQSIEVDRWETENRERANRFYRRAWRLIRNKFRKRSTGR